MPAIHKASNITAPTQLLTVKDQTYAYRRFGSGPAAPLLFLQHFTGTLDNWDPAVTDPLAQRGEVILFESAGLFSPARIRAPIPGVRASRSRGHTDPHKRRNGPGGQAHSR